jgi:hypothetical protein
MFYMPQIDLWKEAKSIMASAWLAFTVFCGFADEEDYRDCGIDIERPGK